MAALVVSWPCKNKMGEQNSFDINSSILQALPTLLKIREYSKLQLQYITDCHMVTASQKILVTLH
jgi:hypothetical protein